MKTKKEIFDYFDGQISMKAIQQIDDEWQVVGKWCRVAFDDDGMLDIWVCNPGNMASGLTEHKLTAVLGKFAQQGVGFRRLTGEAYTKVAGKGVILQNLSLLGIRRKRRVSEEARRKSAERLARLRAA